MWKWDTMADAKGSFGHSPKARRLHEPAHPPAGDEDRGGHSPKAKTADVKQIVSQLPTGPAPAAPKQADTPSK